MYILQQSCMESVFSFRYDGINFNKPLQLAIWNHENDSE